MRYGFIIKISLIFILSLISIFLGKHYPAFEKITEAIIVLLPVLIYILFKDSHLLPVILLLFIKSGKYIFPLKYNLSSYIYDNPFVSVIVALYAFYKVGKLFYSFISLLIKELKSNKSKDYYLVIQQVFSTIYPNQTKYANLISQEFSILVYSLFIWKRYRNRMNEFSYTQLNGVVVIYVAILSVGLIETFLIHVLLLEFKLYIISYVLFFLNVYALLGIIAHMKAMKFRPIKIENGLLFLRNGLYSNCTLELNNIKLIEKNEKDIYFIHSNTLFKFSLLNKVEMHNIRIVLKENTTINLFYGLQKIANEIYFYVDEKNSFIEAINYYHPAAVPYMPSESHDIQ